MRWQKVWRYKTLLGTVHGARWCAIRAVNRYGLVSKTTRTEKAPGARYPVLMRMGGSSDPEVFDAIFIDTILGELASRVHGARVIVDLGANVGYSSVFFLNAFPDAFVLAVEPDPQSAEICRQNLALYGDRTQVIQAAIWSHSTRLALSRGSFRDGKEWATQVRPANPDESAEVEGVDMPSILQVCPYPTIDILKIDIEGSEATLFGAGAKHWLRFVRNFCVEIHSIEALAIIEDTLRNFDFEYKQCGEYNVYLNLTPKALNLAQVD
jgi:FkbM family methyltransferase